MFNLITNDQANSLCADCDAPNAEWCPMNEDWQLSLKVDGTYHLYWYLPLSQRVKAIPQWTKNQSAIKEFCGDKPITTVSWSDEPLHPINDLSRFYNGNGATPLHESLSADEGISNKFLYRFLLPHVAKIPHMYDAHRQCFTFSKDDYGILRQVHCINDGIPQEVAYAADIIIATLQADNDRTVSLVE